MDELKRKEKLKTPESIDRGASLIKTLMEEEKRIVVYYDKNN